MGMPVVRTDGRAVGRSVYVHVITKFSRMGSLPHFLPIVLCALRAPELRYKPRCDCTDLACYIFDYNNLTK